MTTREENLKKINAELEKLSDEELENVAGGTVGELEDLTVALVSKWPAIAGMGKVDAHIPGANKVIASAVESILEKDLGISANINLGVGGTGIFSKSNTYTDIATGKRLSHSEVLSIINEATKS